MIADRCTDDRLELHMEVSSPRHPKKDVLSGEGLREGGGCRALWPIGDHQAGWREKSRALGIDPSWSVLDIGAGPGTLPLARRAKRVTALETSLAMVKRLKRHVGEEGLSNIR